MASIWGPLTSLLATLESTSRVLHNEGTKAASAVVASAIISDIIPGLFASVNLFVDGRKIVRTRDE